MKTLALPKISVPTSLIVGAGVAVVAALGLVWLFRNGAMNAGATVVKGAADLGAGAVVGFGEAIGIPATSQSECDVALAEGRLWDASFACPASRFLGGVFSSRVEPSKIDPNADSSGVPFNSPILGVRG